MDYEPGEEYDCDACGGTHVVERGKGLEVSGSSEGLDPALYVRCPTAGFRSLTDPDATGGAADDEDWP
jgi:hypothetical protein